MTEHFWPEPQCWNCERAGHTFRTCPERDDDTDADYVEEDPETLAEFEMLRALDAELADVEIPDVPDYGSYTLQELIVHSNEIRERLLDLHEMLVPRSDEGRQLHIERGTVRAEMDRRRATGAP